MVRLSVIFYQLIKSQNQIESLKIAAEKLDRLLIDKGITEDELVEEFRQLQQEEKNRY